MMMKPKLITFLSFTLLFAVYGNAQSLKDSLMANGYLFEQFEQGQVLLKKGAIEPADLNYNYREQSIAFEQNGQYLIVTNPEEIDTIYIGGKKFIPIDKKFYKVLMTSNVTLLNTYTETNHPMTATNDQNGFSRQNTNQVSNTVSGVYVNRNYKGSYSVDLKKQYWLIKGDHLYKGNNEQQIISRFPTKSKEISNYIKDNNVKIGEEKDMVKLLSYCNSLIQQ